VPLPLKDHFAPNELAHYWSVTRQTIYNWIVAGKLEAKKIGGVLRVTRESAENYEKEFFALE
jgi:excisionase family DNA binding protein